ncbi:monovalent cation/H(+) antiporter subunit G [Chloroflexota bacterium]
MTILAIILMVSGGFFLTVSAIGLLRLPDFYARTHAVGKSETLGTILVLSGLAVYNGWELSTVKILFIMFFALIANPTATHAIARAAFRSGLPLWIQKKAPADKDNNSDDKLESNAG